MQDVLDGPYVELLSRGPTVYVREFTAKDELNCSCSKKVTAILLATLPSPWGLLGAPAWLQEKED